MNNNLDQNPTIYSSELLWPLFEERLDTC